MRKVGDKAEPGDVLPSVIGRYFCSHFLSIFDPTSLHPPYPTFLPYVYLCYVYPLMPFKLTNRQQEHNSIGTTGDQPPVLAVLGSVLVPLLRAFSGTGLRNRFVPSDLFRISGCRIGPIPTCPLFSHFRSPSGTIPVGTTYTTTKPSDIDPLAHPRLPSTHSPLQPRRLVSRLPPQCCHARLPISDRSILTITTSRALPVSAPRLPDVDPSFLIWRSDSHG